MATTKAHVTRSLPRKGSVVEFTSGKYKGRRGIVKEVSARARNHVFVEVQRDPVVIYTYTKELTVKPSARKPSPSKRKPASKAAITNTAPA